jgi:hypothetical protein
MNQTTDPSFFAPFKHPKTPASYTSSTVAETSLVAIDLLRKFPSRRFKPKESSNLDAQEGE